MVTLPLFAAGLWLLLAFLLGLMAGIVIRGMGE